MATESTAMDCAESTENPAEEAQETPAKLEQEAGSPTVAEKHSACSTVAEKKEEKAAEDVEMQDLTLEDPAPSSPLGATAVTSEKPKEEGKEAGVENKEVEEQPKDDEGKESITIDIPSSPVPVAEPENADEATDKPPLEVDSDSSVELIESPGPVKSPASHDTAEDQEKSDNNEKPSETEAKEAEDLADSSIELISSPTSESSPEKEVENKEQDEQKDQLESDDHKEQTNLPIMDVDEGESSKPSADKTEEMVCEEKPQESADQSMHTPMEIEVQPSADKKDDILEVELEKPTVAKESEDEQLSELPSDGDIFYGKDCINCNCKRLHKQYVLTNMATLNFYKVARKSSKQQFLCMGCHDTAMDLYEDYAGHLVAKQPLLLKEFDQDHADFVALDSSDEEEEEKPPEKSDFSKNELQLIEDELEDAIKSVLLKVEFKNQLSWSKTILQAKADRLERQFALADAEFEKVQSTADKMHCALYNSCPVVHKHLPPLEIEALVTDYVHQVPPAGEIVRPPIQLGETYYAVKNKAIASWVSIKVIEFTESTAINGNTMKSFKIRYLNMPYQMIKTVTAKHIAYFEPPPVRLTIGTRVIAYFDGTTLSRGKEKGVVQSAFYPGIIAEPLKQANRYRYLIFYDDGYTQYVPHRDVRLVCQASEKVWEDVHAGSRDFIQKYVEKYSVDRPMVQCTRGQSMNTESNGTWLYARVIDIDCSLVLMQFEGDKNHTEWIYRGSLRLGPVFKETQNTMNSASSQQMRVPRRTEPFIRYTKEMESSSQVNQQMRAIARKSSSSGQSAATATPVSSPATLSGGRSTPGSASSSASNNASAVRHLNNSTIYVDDENRPKGHVVYFTAKRNLPPKMYRSHECNPNCLFKIVHRLDSYSPLAKPLLSGWERLVFRQKTKKCVVYKGPCGRSLRNLAEVHIYLRATENVLNVDNFDFTPDLKCLAEYSIDPSIVKDTDISKGQEKMAIPLVNYYDNTLPPPCTYAKQRIPTEGVHLNLDDEFLVCCDCEDDCSDKSKCACWQLTVAGVRYCNPKKPIEEIGYQYKRLHEHVPTGIYECNSRCRCRKNCLNRVVQFSLEMKLQVFKTSNRGWGLRCVNDIPKGAFICIYAGHLLTETMANEGGQDAGDEYFADLDYIEVAEQLKEGYESEVDHSEPDPEEDNGGPDAEDDDDFRPNYHYQRKSKRSSRSSSTQSSELDSQERTVINFNPNADLDETVRENSVRRLFGKDEAPYIMDAKTTGNLGRYFNHSCNPNLFVQNVFVDTHDLRFPWVAFFSASHIRSGTELTWNYNYEVGVVPGKVLYCQCGAPNCRIRLL
ncbi:histone-lysine N-methyltransferase eggless [Drosophila gunungcola]|uniref:histone-lysine N-methyltransferase eggless n=1 Tax=Drosophila gunungcola TaxID=103775 RepID=UPI0022E1E2A8|nr:histone-lysine N-methyltransferase eggless [Drosophila gunungcola]